MKGIICLLVLLAGTGADRTRGGGRGLWDNLPASYSPPGSEAEARTRSGQQRREDGFWSQIRDQEDNGEAEVSRGGGSRRGLNRPLGYAVNSVGDLAAESKFNTRPSKAEKRTHLAEEEEPGTLAVAESRADHVLRVHRLATDTLDSLQGKSHRGSGLRGSGRRGSGSGRRGGSRSKQSKGSSRRFGSLRRQGEVLVDTEDVGNISVDEEGSQPDNGMDGKRLAAQVNAVSVLDMIKNLQEEIKDIDAEIMKENDKMRRLKEQKERESLEPEFLNPTSNVAEESAEETMKELNLQKEDTTMKKIIAQMMLMKQIQKKKSESDKLEIALQKLADRRKLINTALRKQKEIAEEKRRLAKLEIDRQKEIMAEKEKVIQEILQRQEEERRKKAEEKLEEQKQISLAVKQKLQKQADISDKTGMLEAHLRLVDRSNDRILARIQEIKLQREQEAIAEQERLLLEQQAAINALRSLQKERRQKQKKKKKQKVASLTSSSPPRISKLNIKESALLSLSPQERKQVLEWLDLERNAEILQKTDLKIAEKLRAKQAAQKQNKIGSSDPMSSALKIKNAAQILLDDDITDSEIDDILGLSGIDSGLSDGDILDMEDPEIIDLDDDALLFDDYEYYDDEDYLGDDDYYDYYDDDDDYEDDYVEKEYIYEYEEDPLPALPPPAPRPRPPPPLTQPPKPRYPSKPYRPYRPRKPAYRPSYSPPSSYGRPSYTKHSGAQFLDEVSGLLNQAEVSLDRGVQPHITLTGSLRNALLRDVQDHVTTEIKRLPGGRVSTKVRIGGPPQLHLPSNPATSRVPVSSSPLTSRQSLGSRQDPRTPRRPAQRHRSRSSAKQRTGGSVQRSDNREKPRSKSPTAFSDLVMRNSKDIGDSPTFEDLMGDLLEGKPLPPEISGVSRRSEHPGSISLS